jgi:hypothetical protein
MVNNLIKNTQLELFNSNCYSYLRLARVLGIVGAKFIGVRNEKGNME